MKIAVYPGSFNPWHQGHSDILGKALHVFDQVIVARGINPDKTDLNYDITRLLDDFRDDITAKGRITIQDFRGLLADFIKEVGAHAVVRGLRNGSDLQYEMNQQYWNEDLGISCPTVLFICDREYSHISSSTIRALKGFKK